jgi:energy-coupling factor transport system substrate-specific component
VGILTPLIDSRVEVWLPQFFFNIHNTVNVFTYTGGPLNGDLLVAWEEYGAVLASYLVRKPGAATLAMGINGLGQYILVDSLQGPHHLVYFVAGLGADLVFGLFRYKRYDVASCIVAGIASQLFWIPVSYVYHNVLSLYTTNFIVGDISTRILGGAVGDGLLGGALGYVILHIALAVRRSRVRKNPVRTHDVSLRKRTTRLCRAWSLLDSTDGRCRRNSLR